MDAWRQLSIIDRCRVIRGVTDEIVASRDELVDLCRSASRIDPVETITAELFPLCAAIDWIGRKGAATLATRYVGFRGRPIWLWGVGSEVRRVPRGNVLILAAWNYPLLLPGVQAAQAIAAGNHVLLKPAPGCEQAMQRLARCFYDAGVPKTVLQILPSDTQAAVEAMDAGVDLVVLTGSASTGRKVLAKAAQTLTPAIMELSGCDAAVVLPQADRNRVTDAIWFGLTFNSGATCIAPRRIITDDSTADQLVELLSQRCKSATRYHVHPAAQETVRDVIQDAMTRGARPIGPNNARIDQDGMMRPAIFDHVGRDFPIANSDLFAPVSSIIRVESMEMAIEVINQANYRLSASLFGPAKQAERIATKLCVGNVVINDLIVPTADPRIPFGGRGQSGFGVTRGPEGLLAMTTPQVIQQRKGRFLPHLRPRDPMDEPRLTAMLEMSHRNGLKTKIAALARMIKRV